MKRLAIFAGYDRDNIIDDYVVYYIKELKKIADIIYVSDCDMSNTELEKIAPYCIQIINGRHGEYDFGSYKRGFVYARVTKLIFNYDALILCNDSVFGPFYGLKEIVENMENKNLDAWSMFHCFYDYVNIEHLQSYFVSIKKEIFEKQNFVYFIQSIMRLNTKDDMIVHHEFGLTKFFLDNNYKIGGYFDSSSLETNGDTNFPYHKTEELIKKGFPFFKRNILLSEDWLKMLNFNAEKLKNIVNIIKDNYDINLMKNNIERVLNIDFNTLLPLTNKKLKIVNNNILNHNREFILLGFNSNNKYIIIYIFGIKFSIKRNKSKSYE